MEVTGAVTFRNSDNHLGDGDSKGFQKVIDKKSYDGEITVDNLECIGHMQKQMGTRLRTLKPDMKGKKLDGGMPCGGDKLTDA